MMVSMRRRHAASIALFTSVTFLMATPNALAATSEAATPAEQRIATKLTKRIANARLGGDVGIVVLDQTTGRIVFAEQADEPMLTASNMKIVTAMNVLATHTPDDVFTTSVLRGSSPNSVILRGGGDPLLTRTALKDLAETTAPTLDPTQPVTVYADISRFGTPVRPSGWPRGYIPSVASPVTSLAMLGDYSTDPTGNAVDVFIAKLRKLGFTAQRGADVVAPADATVIASDGGHTVRQAVARMLRDSENNVAEVLFRQVAVKTGLPGTWDGARQAANAQLSALGIDPSALAARDGSGLSRSDRMTPRAFATLVRTSRLDPRFASMYEPDAMPIGGQTGTLHSKYQRFTTAHSRCAQGAVRAKTGTLRDTIGLTGVTPSSEGTDLDFSILVNHRPQRFSQLATRQAVDGLVATIHGCW